MITQSELHSMFAYIPETGKMIHLHTVQGGKQAGQEAGSPHCAGYLQIGIKRKKYLIHRLIWLYVYGKWPTQVDHINGDRSDNRLENLRECNYSQNHGNKRLNSNNTSGYKGVFFDKRRKTWFVEVAHKYVGRFRTKQEAADAYDEYAKKHYGDFALTNKEMK